MSTKPSTVQATTDDERALLNTQKDKLDAERLKLVQAHYADAIPLHLLKVEQERIRANLDAIKHRLANLATSYEDARESLGQLAGIFTDLDDVYTRCEPAERRILNQALFDKIILDDEQTIRYQPGPAVQTALDCKTQVRRHSPSRAHPTPKTHRILPAVKRGSVRKCHFWWSLGESNP
ncbi:hypothetical protein [Neomicrococcus lactis]|uniref:hypothetical protein n=1 Tax=Neomicrococcus lactis TaxID=732241 RepID=UPI002300BF0A|nr:hypothetical protein [Neomicrococcus lactis]